MVCGDRLVQDGQRLQAVYPEVAIVSSQSAPRGQDRDVDVVDQGNGPDDAVRYRADAVLVVQAQLVPVPDGGADYGEVDAVRHAGAAFRDSEGGVRQGSPDAFGKDYGDLGQDALGRLGEVRVAQAVQQAHADGDGIGFLGGEHQRRQV